MVVKLALWPTLSVNSGSFKITDKVGHSANFTTIGAATLDDVVQQINGNTNISVVATITDLGLKITDNSGGAGQLIVADGDTLQKVATGLGIAATTSGSSITGANINTIGNA